MNLGKRYNYFDHKLTYTNDGKLLDEYGHAIMMDWESDWMKESANVICQNGGDVLNIGFGMGFIDGYIQQHQINSHTIIEAHPDVYEKMIKDGWDKKPNVKIIFAKYQDVINELPKFDGIYYDTWNDPDFYDLLLPNIKNILKLNGIFSYWEGLSNQYINQVVTDIMYKDFEFDVKIFELENVPTKEDQYPNTKGFYFNPNWRKYVIPIIKHRKLPIKKTLI